MLTEQFVASIAAHTKPNTGVTKDAGIFVHEHQPLSAQRHVFKKSVTAPNGLGVSESHVFAAQDGKAVVHVYHREKGNQEAVIPFNERVRSLAMAGQTGALVVMGLESGRICVWEVASGRLVSTSTSHLQPVTVLAVDPTGNFFLSGADDAMIHVWNLPSILSFSPDTSRAPIHTLSTHRGPITSLVCGHSSSSGNIAVSVSQDRTAMVWDYHNGQMLRTYLLPEAPTAVVLDPADRAFYVAYEDGSLQTIIFYDEAQQKTPVDVLRDGSSSHIPVTPSPKTRFNAESQKLGAAMSLSLSWDGTTLLSGHASGKIATWDIAKGNYISTVVNLPGPVTNLQFLAPTGFTNASEPKLKIHTVTKPKQDLGSANGSGYVPANYALNVQFPGPVHVPNISAPDKGRKAKSEFEEALAHPVFPTAMLEDSLAELGSWGAQTNGQTQPAADFLSFNNTAAPNGTDSTASQQELTEVKRQLASLQRIQKASLSQLSQLREEKEYLVKREETRAKRKALRAIKLAKTNGKTGSSGDVEMSDRSEVDGESESDDIAASDSLSDEGSDSDIEEQGEGNAD
ncbi:WD domain-containing protein [Lophiotrema nucula]|uniref:Pre-rRNA-processing protein IPI3 n=1 Tax=Lophiotrema nucula TaxID=690887 RepID=A0A6A5YSU6_9PLEO|nr:WD domain-containing protein [Lophiotrema nucula]